MMLLFSPHWHHPQPEHLLKELYRGEARARRCLRAQQLPGDRGRAPRRGCSGDQDWRAGKQEGRSDPERAVLAYLTGIDMFSFLSTLRGPSTPRGARYELLPHNDTIQEEDDTRQVSRYV